MEAHRTLPKTPCSHDVTTHFFRDPFCDYLSTAEKIAIIAFHVLTLFIPLILSKITSCCFSRGPVNANNSGGSLQKQGVNSVLNGGLGGAASSGAIKKELSYEERLIQDSLQKLEKYRSSKDDLDRRLFLGTLFREDICKAVMPKLTIEEIEKNSDEYELVPIRYEKFTDAGSAMSTDQLKAALKPGFAKNTEINNLAKFCCSIVSAVKDKSPDEKKEMSDWICENLDSTDNVCKVLLELDRLYGNNTEREVLAVDFLTFISQKPDGKEKALAIHKKETSLIKDALASDKYSEQLSKYKEHIKELSAPKSTATATTPKPITESSEVQEAKQKLEAYRKSERKEDFKAIFTNYNYKDVSADIIPLLTPAEIERHANDSHLEPFKHGELTTAGSVMSAEQLKAVLKPKFATRVKQKEDLYDLSALCLQCVKALKEKPPQEKTEILKWICEVLDPSSSMDKLLLKWKSDYLDYQEKPAVLELTAVYLYFISQKADGKARALVVRRMANPLVEEVLKVEANEKLVGRYKSLIEIKPNTIESAVEFAEVELSKPNAGGLALRSFTVGGFSGEYYPDHNPGLKLIAYKQTEFDKYLITELKAYKEAWPRKGTLEAADKVMKMSYYAAIKVLEDLPHFLKKEGKQKTAQDVFRDVGNYQYKAFEHFTFMYHAMRAGMHWEKIKVKMTISKVSTEEEFECWKHDKSAEVAADFYKDGTVQNLWRTLYNNYCDRFAPYAPALNFNPNRVIKDTDATFVPNPQFHPELFIKDVQIFLDTEEFGLTGLLKELAETLGGKSRETSFDEKAFKVMKLTSVSPHETFGTLEAHAFYGPKGLTSLSYKRPVR